MIARSTQASIWVRVKLTSGLKALTSSKRGATTLVTIARASCTDLTCWIIVDS